MPALYFSPHRYQPMFHFHNRSRFNNHVESPRQIEERRERRFLSHTSARAHHLCSRFTTPDQFLASSSLSATSYCSVINIARSVRIHWGLHYGITRNVCKFIKSNEDHFYEKLVNTRPKTKKWDKSKQSYPSPQWTIQKERSELDYKTKSSQTTFNFSPNNHLHTFFKDAQCYDACLSCHKIFMQGQTPTPRVTIHCKCWKTAMCSSYRNCF